VTEGAEPKTGPVAVLVGAPGAGKSIVGRLLAARLGVAFRDTDTEIEARAGKPIGDIFVDDGEPAFRELERAAVRDAVTGHDGVLALGSGAILDASTRALLRGRRVVFLDVSLAEAVRRVGFNRDRPVLLGNPRAQLMRLLEARVPLYREVATVTVSTDGADPDDVAAAVIVALGAGE
jgi:shikimate kinase